MAIFKSFKSNIFLIQFQNREKIKPHTSTKSSILINTIKGVVDKKNVCVLTQISIPIS